MSFISYAQNYEDLMLWRALNHIKTGFYIDVGANDPEIESVTKAFYDNGWIGINIEPVISHYEDLQQKRPRDINLLCAVGDKSGEIEIFNCDVRGWATGVQDLANMYINEGHRGKFNRVPLRTLEDICKDFVSTDIHFLKIDVEGFEKEVLNGADFVKYRPWIIVVEATRPNSTEEVHGEWEPILLKANYVFAYADGLNRFYVAKENSELISSFRYPPNVFDEVIRIDQLNADINVKNLEDKARDIEERALQAEAMIQEAVIRAERAEAKAIEVAIQTENLEYELNKVYRSCSWRITAPFRWINDVAHRFFLNSSKKE